MASSKTKRSTKSSKKSVANSKKTTSRSTRSTRMTKAEAEAIAREEQRAMEVRRDIRMLLFFGIMVFLFISALGYGGIIGKAVSSVMFGLFGVPAYFFPVFVALVVVFVISNLGKRTLPARTAALTGLYVSACTAFEIFSGEVSAAGRYDPAMIYQRCAASKEGGGLLGGTIAYGLFRMLREVGSIFVLVIVILICLMVLTQFSPVEEVRKVRAERIRRGDPSFMERRRLRAREARALTAARKEAVRIEKEKRRREREELLLQDKQNREERLRIADAKSEAVDMLSTKIEEVREEEEDFGLDEGTTFFGKKSGTAAKRSPEVKEPAKSTASAPVREPAPERIRTGTAHGIRILDRGEKESGKPEEIRISAAPVSTPEAGEAERILRPDPNTVRFESEGLIHSRSGEGDPFESDTGRATMTVFTRTVDTGSSTEDLQFPFYDGGSEKNMKKVYARESAAEQLAGGIYPDIADAGGMSTFQAQQTARSGSPGEPESKDEDIPWGADALTEEEIAALEAEEVAYDRRQAAAGSERKAKSIAETVNTPKRSAANAASEKVSAAGRAQEPISEEDLEGIEVHRERVTEAKPVGTTAVSSLKRSPENRQYNFPPFSLMQKGRQEHSPESDKELKETALRLQETLRIFGVNVTITDICQGPSVTRYELQPEKGVKVSKVLNLANDIKLSLAAADIRIEAPIPGKPAIGIEVPNKNPTLVALRDILESQEFRNAKSKLSFALGKDVAGNTIVADIAKMPHLLIAGTTGSGKSVCISTIIMSILYKASPDEVQMIMVDPKVVELNVYNGIPHLMIPVVTDPKKASAALNWSVAEMERRYQLFALAKVKDLNGYNALVRSKGENAGENEKVLPRIVVIVDELADLMMVCKNDVEASICRLAQLARAAGIHLIIATQRPSVDVITGLIKANMPSRIAFAVASNTDSRTILDMNGAEKLIGKGDMLFYPQNFPKPARYQGAFVSEEEIVKVVDYIKDNNQYDTLQTADIDKAIDKMASSGTSGSGPDTGGDSGYDEYFERAGRFVIEKDKASIGMLQRVLKIGFNRAARIMDQLADAGVVSQDNGTRARQVLMNMPQFEQLLEEM